MREYFIETIVKILDTYLIYLNLYNLYKDSSVNSKFKYVSMLDDINLEDKIDECQTIDDQINLLYKIFAYTRKSHREILCTLTVKKDYIQIYIKDTLIRFYYNGEMLEPQLITLNHSFLTVVNGTNFKLTATIYPENALYNHLTWVSNNEDVAIVDVEGNVQALSSGTVTISVIGYNNISANCIVNVIDDILEFKERIDLLDTDIIWVKNQLDLHDQKLIELESFIINNIKGEYDVILNNVNDRLNQLENEKNVFIYGENETIEVKNKYIIIN